MLDIATVVSEFESRLGPVTVSLAGGSMKADTARGRAALRSVPVRFEFVVVAGQVVVSKCANHVDRHHYFTDTHVINSPKPASFGGAEAR
jgi:hypothetical protein